MPSTTRALTRAARKRAAAQDIPFTAARETELAIRARMRTAGETYAEAEAALQALADGPEICPDCGGPIICPECPGCACYNGRCTGWRHWGSVDFAMPDDGGERDRCHECGAVGSYGYRCDC